MDFFKKMSDKEKKVLYIAIVLVTLALLDRLLLGPASEKLRMIDEEIKQEEIIIQRDARFLRYKDQILKESESFEKYFTVKAPDNDVINAEFLSIIEKLATQSNVVLAKSNPSKAKVHKQFIEYTAELECSGELKNVISFMYAINTTEDLLKISKFNISPKKGTESDVIVSMTIVKLLIARDMSNLEEVVTP
ncbi:MAG TPA: type 4a pilus biogenesis protein PilO [Candidatus Omnitrophota bacterium]|nr:type 4a pilus biogenesis protein PilO [Candidatus Omnitrophota bacterium]